MSEEENWEEMNLVGRRKLSDMYIYIYIGMVHFTKVDLH